MPLGYVIAVVILIVIAVILRVKECLKWANATLIITIIVALIGCSKG